MDIIGRLKVIYFNQIPYNGPEILDTYRYNHFDGTPSGKKIKIRLT